MIPKEAFWSITAVMALGWAFGVVCDRTFIRWAESHSEPQDDPDIVRYTCDTCRYENTKPTEEPCLSCLEDDVDRWEKDE